MDTQRVPVNSLLQAPYNPRVSLSPGDIAYESLKSSMEAFGVVEPIIYNKRTSHIVSGHQRLNILCSAGVEEVDTVVVDLPEHEEKILNLSLNKIQGYWDTQKLDALLSELMSLDSVELTGFTEEEVAALTFHYAHIDDLLMDDFASPSQTNRDTYTVTFTLPAGVMGVVSEYIQNFGKKELALDIIQHIRGNS